jgi:hypothetical protein
MTINQILVNPNKIIRFLIILAVILIIASIVGQLIKYVLGHPTGLGLIRIFSLNEEANIPTFFSSLLMILAASLLGIIALFRRRQNNLHDSKLWSLLCIGLLYMAFDESSQIHEMLASPIKGMLGEGKLGFLYFAWVIPFIPIVIVIGLLMVRFLTRLPKKTRLAFLTSGIIYVLGAIIIEMIGGRYAELNGQENLVFNMIGTVEETFELAGLIGFVWALLIYLADNFGEMQVQIVKGHTEK